MFAKFYPMFAWLLIVAYENDDSFMDELMRGEWFGAITGVYAQTLGGIFYIIVFLLGPTLIGIKSQRFAPVSMAILISGIAFAMLFETPVQFFFAVAALLGLAGVFYSVVHK